MAVQVKALEPKSIYVAVHVVHQFMSSWFVSCGGSPRTTLRRMTSHCLTIGGMTRHKVDKEVSLLNPLYMVGIKLVVALVGLAMAPVGIVVWEWF